MVKENPLSFDPNFSNELQSVSCTLKAVMDAISTRIVGQALLRRRLVEALLTGSHLLLEGVPGLAKTMSIKALANSVHGSFARIQFTPDLLPADLIGTEIFRPHQGSFEVRKGPVFANFILADEINRAPAKVQSALLETMQELQVTIGEKSYPVPSPFFVLATQNPIEQEGTYPLPEAQVDRFAMKVKVDYPTPEEELEILEQVTDIHYSTENAGAVATLDEIVRAMDLCKRVYVDERVRQYIVNIVWATRDPQRFNLKLNQLIELGASPRASINFLQLARAEAVLEGESFVVPQNVKDVAIEVLRHRLVPTYEAEAQGLTSDDLVKMILEGIQVP